MKSGRSSGSRRVDPRAPGPEATKSVWPDWRPAGLLSDAGRHAIEIAQANGSWNSLDAIDALVLPDDLATALAARRGAREPFYASSPAVRRMALAWVYGANRPQARAARVAQVAAVAERSEPIASLWRRD